MQTPNLDPRIDSEIAGTLTTIRHEGRRHRRAVRNIASEASSIRDMLNELLDGARRLDNKHKETRGEPSTD